MTNYLICGNYGAKNIGDEAILSGLLFQLEAKGQGSKFTVLSGNPEETKSIHDVESVKFIPSGIRSALTLGGLKKTLDAYKQADVFILGGGGLFTDHSSLKAAWIWFVQTLIAKLLHKKIVMIGQSIGPLNSKTAKHLTKIAFSWSEDITLRDEASKTLLISLGIKSEIKIAPDLAMNLSEKFKDIIAQKNTPKTEQKTYSVVSLKYLGRTNNVYEQEVVAFINFLINQEMQEVYLKPFGGEQISDEKYMNKFIAQNNLDKNKVHVHTDYSLKSSINLISNAKFLLGMRLHSLILASTCNTPFLGLNYHDKIRNYFSDKKSQILDLDKISYDELRENYKSLTK